MNTSNAEFDFLTKRGQTSEVSKQIQYLHCPNQLFVLTEVFSRRFRASPQSVCIVLIASYEVGVGEIIERQVS